jgi:hypothetical protein
VKRRLRQPLPVRISLVLPEGSHAAGRLRDHAPLAGESIGECLDRALKQVLPPGALAAVLNGPHGLHVRILPAEGYRARVRERLVFVEDRP